MTLKICIVSTYTPQKSRNVGDYLIVTNAEKALRKHFSERIDVRYIEREEDPELAMREMDQADFVLFPGFAIRIGTIAKTYPMLEAMLERDIDFGVISAGTKFNMRGDLSDFMKETSSNDLSLLKRFGERASFFSTRAPLTQMFCQEIGIRNAVFTGDVAFFVDGERQTFAKTPRPIRRIAISDPHKAGVYQEALELLIQSVRKLFPNAECELLLHGRNDIAAKIGAACGAKVTALHETPNLIHYTYQAFDLHVGFRVHGHVASLSAGVPSYLLEQDGRGCEYGLLFSKKLTVPCYLSPNTKTPRALSDSVHVLSAMIEADASNNFRKFDDLDVEVKTICSRIDTFLQKQVAWLTTRIGTG